MLIYFSINEYYESCKILNCQSGYSLSADNKCTKCNVENVVAYKLNTCSPQTCKTGSNLSLDKTKCELCNNDINALTYSNDGKCTSVKCKPGFSVNDGKCVSCGLSNVYEYDDILKCKAKICKPGFKVNDGKCDDKCDNNNGVTGYDNSYVNNINVR